MAFQGAGNTNHASGSASGPSSHTGLGTLPGPRLAPAHRAQPSSSSTSSYAPVLINPTHTDNSTSTSPPVPSIALRYPYPLPIASLLDLAYTLHHQYRLAYPDIPDHSAAQVGAGGPLIIAAAARAVVLICVVGSSKRWRTRGGWVAAVCGISVGEAIWKDCATRLGARGGKAHADHPGGKGGGQSMFLYTVCPCCFRNSTCLRSSLA
jgi:hypothetical protein